jgi:hypothetical protein
MTYNAPSIESYGSVEQHTLERYPTPKFSVPLMKDN